MKAFSLTSLTRGVPTSTTFIQHSTVGVLARETGNEEVNNMFCIVKTPKMAQEAIVTNKFPKILEYKVNVQKSIAFLHI